MHNLYKYIESDFNIQVLVYQAITFEYLKYLNLKCLEKSFMYSAHKSINVLSLKSSNILFCSISIPIAFLFNFE